MTAFTAITLPDGQATPANHVFNPASVSNSNGVSVFNYQSEETDSALGNYVITQSLARPAAPAPGTTATNRTYRYRLGISTPILETLSNASLSGIIPAPQVAFVPRVVLEIPMPERSTVQQRKNLLAFARAMLDDPSVTAQVVDLEGIFN